MKHPSPEEWMTFIYGESPAAERQEFNQHLAQCAECQREVARWQSVMGKLDAWKLPATKRRRLAEPIIKWGMAACLVLGFGFFAGRAGATNHAVAELRNEVTAQAAAQDAEIKRLRSSVTDLLDAARQEALADFKRHINSSNEQIMAAAAAQTEQLLLEFAKTVQADRSADQEGLLSFLTAMEQRRAEEMREFRRELETVAVFTEANFQRAQNQLVQLAAAQNAETREATNP